LHHAKRFALTNEHEADTLQPLCKAHENLAHLGLIEHESRSPENWKLLKFSDIDDPKYDIDVAVQQFR
ncbi:hypothetical protein HYV57_02975, partial [Candidatus Peregrinibacteria bacterium]|nr:hypothetical protein [Candidatus Peregrinibacteria bacterium]